MRQRRGYKPERGGKFLVMRMATARAVLKAHVSCLPQRSDVSRSIETLIAARATVLTRSDGDLVADLDDAAGWNLEEIGGIARRTGKADEQSVLPPRHAGARGGFQRPSRQEERRRHDVELPAVLARDRK